MSSTYIPQLDAAHFDRLNAALRPQQGTGYEYVRPKAGIPYPYERSENLLSAPACFDRLNTPLQAAWTYHATNMPCAAFTPVSTHLFASTPPAECRIKTKAARACSLTGRKNRSATSHRPAPLSLQYLLDHGPSIPFL